MASRLAGAFGSILASIILLLIGLLAFSIRLFSVNGSSPQQSIRSQIFAFSLFIMKSFLSVAKIFDFYVCVYVNIYLCISIFRLWNELNFLPFAHIYMCVCVCVYLSVKFSSSDLAQFPSFVCAGH